MTEFNPSRDTDPRASTPVVNRRASSFLRQALTWTVQEQEIELERVSEERVRELADKLARTAAPIWRFGDGYGGHVKQILRDAVERFGLEWEEPPRPKIVVRGSVSRYVREALIARDGLTCCYCHKPLTPRQITIEHITAASKGGTDELDNLKIACRPCNSSKGDRDIDEFAASRTKQPIESPR